MDKPFTLDELVIPTEILPPLSLADVTRLTVSTYPLCYACRLETFMSLNSEGAPHGTSYCRI